ncbi:MAG: enoyl-CoA hydratase-related protein [Lachnospiraceae bacterium]|jgi:enoyl-CoA hydratase
MGYVNFEQQGDVGVVTINRPEALNALNSQILDELESVFDAIDPATTRAVVLTGSGNKSFVAGADIGEMSTMSEKEGRAFGKKGNDIFLKIENLSVPVIAAVNGYCLGGGNELAMCCDIRICSENAVFGQPEVGLGITPGYGGTQRLARIINPGKARELLYTAANIKAEEALSLGLVTAVYQQEELMEAALKMAEKIARNAPIAVRTVKAALNKGISMPIEEAVKIETELFGECFGTDDQIEGMKAFLEKRKVERYNNR